MKSDPLCDIYRACAVQLPARLLDNSQGSAVFTLAEEVALSISYNGINYAVMLVTPANLRDFVIGFSLTNGVVEHPRELYSIAFSEHNEHVSAEVDISNRAFWALKTKRRQLAGTSGCGLCGVEAIDMALPELTPLTPANEPDTTQLAELRNIIIDAQTLARESGAVHAALYLSRSGEVLACREDIGRHNAFDKLIGAVVASKLQQGDAMVVLTSRCSLELVQKAVKARFAVLVTLSAPTALSVKWAIRYGLTLVHLPKRDAPRVYSPL
ncbi:formate dehydrogenase accessory sulfurtransferase FdhD [Aestuariibacter sp. A3R04]|uniref:formate dehydrogenase accessory sulfurtransferase FdhD n=1 Tax=Aestuariibacter sp. A3R04 TaxID=2841571 RepID=UPI001C0A1F27|nr:formate dehydrogenase accessory sulfurtransferase FdhD [Aestuariibacter sp. A3R04]MBU3021272.1 formate dehydrogenase accessory sulfurtransferase FdhD [Aestuariibacter sp. A3R04]